MNFLDKVFPKKDVVKPLPLSFVAWLKQGHSTKSVHERNELTFVVEGASFDVIPPVPPSHCSEVLVCYPPTEERITKVRSVMVEYSMYLLDNFDISDFGHYVRWAHSPVMEFIQHS